jgi:hypothetical protein
MWKGILALDLRLALITIFSALKFYWKKKNTNILIEYWRFLVTHSVRTYPWNFKLVLKKLLWKELRILPNEPNLKSFLFFTDPLLFPMCTLRALCVGIEYASAKTFKSNKLLSHIYTVVLICHISALGTITRSPQFDQLCTVHSRSYHTIKW